MKEKKVFGKSPSLKTFHKGKTIGGHRIISEIGHGGMGTVYKALDSSRNRYVALKVLSPFLQANPEFLKRFHREADAAAKLRYLAARSPEKTKQLRPGG